MVIKPHLLRGKDMHSKFVLFTPRGFDYKAYKTFPSWKISLKCRCFISHWNSEAINHNGNRVINSITSHWCIKRFRKTKRSQHTNWQLTAICSRHHPPFLFVLFITSPISPSRQWQDIFSESSLIEKRQILILWGTYWLLWQVHSPALVSAYALTDTVFALEFDFR